jgi:hypothetical protein
MTKIYKILGAGLLLTLSAASVAAQRPRTTSSDSSTTSTSSSSNVPKPAPAPQTFKAKYQGGIFGYNKKEDGTLTFDDNNQRLVFRNKEQKEVLSLPYATVSGAFADTKSQTTSGGKAVTYIPLPYGANMLGLLSRKKVRYLVLQFNDADTHNSGVTSFKLESKELLASVLSTLADKSGLEPRGEGFVRKKEPQTSENK